MLGLQCKTDSNFHRSTEVRRKETLFDFDIIVVINPLNYLFTTFKMRNSIFVCVSNTMNDKCWMKSLFVFVILTSVLLLLTETIACCICFCVVYEKAATRTLNKAQTNSILSFNENFTLWNSDVLSFDGTLQTHIRSHSSILFGCMFVKSDIIKLHVNSGNC